MNIVRRSLLFFCILCVGVFLIGLRIGERSSVPPFSQDLRVPSPLVIPDQTMVLPPMVITGPSEETSQTEVLNRSTPGVLQIGSTLSSPIARERQIRNVFLRETASGRYSLGDLKIEFDGDGHVQSIVIPEGKDGAQDSRRSRFFLVFAHEISPALFPKFYYEIVRSERYERCADVILQHGGKVTGLFVACLYLPPPVTIV